MSVMAFNLQGVFMRAFLVLFVLSFSFPALAQQPAADPDFMQKALDAIANQRNGALNAEASCEANNGKLAQALKDAQAEVKALKDAAAKQPDK
jgi:hypothetical protein